MKNIIISPIIREKVIKEMKKVLGEVNRIFTWISIVSKDRIIMDSIKKIRKLFINMARRPAFMMKV